MNDKHMDFIKKHLLNENSEITKEYIQKIKNHLYEHENTSFFMNSPIYLNNNFKTLGEYDRFIWKINLEANSMVREEYDSLYLQGDFFLGTNYLENIKKLYYIEGNIISAQWYSYFSVIENLQEYVQKKYLYIKVRGKIKAAGKEIIILKKLNYINELFYPLMEYLVEALKPIEEYTFLIEKENKYEIDKYVIGGIKAADSIQFKSFIPNFESKLEHHGHLNKIIDKATEDMIKLLSL